MFYFYRKQRCVSTSLLFGSIKRFTRHPVQRVSSTLIVNCVATLYSLSLPLPSLPFPLPPSHADRLSRKEAEHSGALSGAIAAVRQETQQRVDEAVERAKHDGEVSNVNYMHKDL